VCINCWCCHEICPSKAVMIDKSWLARKLLR
jgi:formate hydrogenlyase subunit 6/NADH:ubiquinone oxidoreductase subunit I